MLVSYEMVLMGNRAEKLYVTMRERAKAFTATG